MGPEKEFEKNVKQLMQLLKKIMMQYPGTGANEEIAKTLKNSKDMPDVNIFLLNLAPLSPEEFEELDEMFEESILSESHRSGELKYELNGEDVEFLKKHGMRF